MVVICTMFMIQSGILRSWNKYINLGIREEMPFHVRRHFYITNRFVAYTNFVIVLLFIFDVYNGYDFRAINTSICFLICTSIPFLHRLGYVIAPRLLMANVPLVFIFISRFLEGGHADIDYALFSYVILICLFPSLVFFSILHELKFMTIGMVLNLLGLIGSNYFLLWSDGRFMDLESVPFLALKIPELILWTTIVISFLVIKYLNELMMEKNYRIKTELESTKQSLENKVQERTEELELKNKKLIDLAFHNSHIFRAPLTNIIGLAEMLKPSMDEKELEGLMTNLKKSAYQLDKASKAINDGMID